jgi:putative FmdB family regulatory protein
MPIYEYTCHICERDFEELIRRPADEAEVTCPSCGSGEVIKKFSAFGFSSGGAFTSSVGGGGCSSCSGGSCSTCGN